MLPRIRLILPLLLVATTIASAQAPIERRTPPPPQSLWPAPNDIPPGTRLLIGTFDGAHHPACSLDSVDLDRLICAGPRHRPSAIYPRELIASIATVGPHHIPDGLAATTAKSGLAIAGLGLLCGVDGGPPCKTPAAIGLSLLVTGGVLAIVQHHQRKHPPQVLYLASYPPPTPWP
jgi:hypothetical protein